MIFQVVKRLKGQKNPKMSKKKFCGTLYFRNHISYDLHLWYTCMYKWIISPGIIFFKILIFGIIRGVGGGGCKRAKNGPKWQKKIVCLTPYLRNCTSYDCKFWCTCVKWSYLQHIFSFFKILILGGFREIKGKKWSKITNFNLFSSISQEL